MPSDGSSIMSAAAGLTNVSVPSAAMAQTPSPMFSVIEDEPLALDMDLLIELGVAERPVAHGGQRPQQAPVGVVEGLIPAPARRDQPLLLAGDGHRRGQPVGPWIVGS